MSIKSAPLASRFVRRDGGQVRLAAIQHDDGVWYVAVEFHSDGGGIINLLPSPVALEGADPGSLSAAAGADMQVSLAQILDPIRQHKRAFPYVLQYLKTVRYYMTTYDGYVLVFDRSFDAHDKVVVEKTIRKERRFGTLDLWGVVGEFAWARDAQDNSVVRIA